MEGSRTETRTEKGKMKRGVELLVSSKKRIERTKEDDCFQYTGESFCSEYSSIPQYAVVVKGCISIYIYIYICVELYYVYNIVYMGSIDLILYNDPGPT